MTASSLSQTSADAPQTIPAQADTTDIAGAARGGSGRSTPPKIKLTLLLAGGHQQTLFLERDSLLLKQLAFAMIARTKPEQTTELLQIPLEDGRSSLCFATADLVGLVSDPPVIFQRSDQTEQAGLIGPATQVMSNSSTQSAVSSSTATRSSPQSIAARTDVQAKDVWTEDIQAVKDSSILSALKRPLQPTPQVAPGVLPSKYFLAENFLPEQECQQLLNYVLERESHFVPSSTTTGDEDYRQSLVLHQFPPFAEVFRKKIRQHLPELLPALDLEPFEASEIEAQLTAHNDGNYFKLHNDSGSLETATRILTYVYYFYRQPKPFSGGELKIYDSKVENGFYVAADSTRLIEPRNNSIIFFLSRYMHEVLEVSSPSRTFADSRFTVNGWVRR